MAITRRQFVTRLGALAAAVGMSQADLSRIGEAFGQIDPSLGGTLGKPRVVWVHGAECTGCSVSVLSTLESVDGKPIYGDKETTLLDALTGAGFAGFTLPDALRLDSADGLVNIADVVIDVIDLQYHETIMGMGGDLAAQWLHDFMGDSGAAPFVLVVEGALQDRANATGAWRSQDTTGEVPWCSIGMSDGWNAEDPAASELAGEFELDMPEVVETLAVMSNCAAIVPIGQCASFGGYPGCKANLASDEFDVSKSQTGAMGTYAYLTSKGETAAAGKVINVPGCPTNPFWFVLTVVVLMMDIQAGGGVIGPTAIDSPASRRLKMAYPIPVHSAYCPRYKYFTQGVYASKPGDKGCLQKIGCKGLYTRSLCGVHGWNNQQPQNGAAATIPNALGGGHCTSAGHPCMGCTEPGYPDRFVPFVRL